MIRNALKFIIAAAVMVGISFGVVFLASSRSLPFLAKEAPQYSTPEISEPDPESDPEESVEESSHTSEESSSYTETPVPAAVKFAEECESLHADSVFPRDRRYDADKEKIVLIENSLTGLDGENAVTAVRMGFVFLEDGRLLDSSLNDITGLAEGYTFLGVRDSQGYPVFSGKKGYYRYDGENGFVSSSYDPVIDVTGFDFDVPSYLCEQQMGIRRIYTKKTKYYAYYGEDRIQYCYNCKEVYAFYPFIENGVERGIGCAIKRVKSEDHLVFYSTRFRHLNDTTDNTLNSEYYPPESRGIESIGYFYFCDGYIRVRVRTDGGWEERLMDTGCNLARTLSGFDIKGYSDGCILYERDGKYGFTTNSLNWITVPDLLAAEPFTEGLAAVTTEKGAGLIDTSGAYILPDAFTRVTPCSGGVFAAYSPDTGWLFFAKVSADAQNIEYAEESLEESFEEVPEESSSLLVKGSKDE